MIKEWDGGVFRCETCDNLFLWKDYDKDARMCVLCALVDLMENGERNGEE